MKKLLRRLRSETQLKKKNVPQSPEAAVPAGQYPKPRLCIAKREPSCRVCFDLPMCTSKAKLEGCPHSVEIPLPQLRNSAWNTNCQTCHVLFGALHPLLAQIDEDYLQSLDLIAYEGLSKILELNTHMLLITPRGPDTEPVTRVSKHDRGKKRQWQRRGIYAAELFARRGRRPWLSIWLEARLPVYKSPDSQFSHAMVRNWVSDCMQNHDRCKRLAAKRSKFAPDRLVEIASPALMRLSTKHSNTTPYVALSYCWGARTIFSTTNENISNHLVDIPWDMMPATFRQAVNITLVLGFKYIWIDALCIIQKNAEDFAQQSSKMGDIYSNAVVVISADSGETVQDGFLDERENASVEIKIPPWKRELENDVGLIIARPSFKEFSKIEGYQIINPTTLGHWSFHSDPTLDRAWCFQEQRLAARIVHYTTNETYWECATQTRCECGLEEISPMSAQLLARHDGESQNLQGITKVQFWWDLVEGYSQRELTNVSDRFPAFSGLAQRMQCKELGAYCAGLWTSDLPIALLWTTRGLLPSKEITLPETYVGPTWSWMSILSPIWEPTRNSVRNVVATVKEIRCQRSSTSEYGPLSSAYIVITGPTKVDDIETRAMDPEDTGASEVRYASAMTIQRRADNINNAGLLLHADLLSKTSDSWSCYSGDTLCIIISYNEKLRGWEGLALVKSNREVGSYERIGYIEYYGQLGNEWEEKTVRII